MANTNETRTTYADFMKYEYGPKIIETTPERSVLLQALESKTANMPWGGKSLTLPVLYGAMGSTASLGEGDAMPDSTPINIDNTVIPMYWHYMRVSVTGQAEATSQGDRAGWGSAMAKQIYVKTKAFRQQMNREACGDGNARLCQVDGAIASQVITVDNAGGWSGLNNSAVNGARYLSPNMYVQSRDSGGTVEDAGLLITSISTAGAWPSTSAKITVSGTCSSVDDGSFLYAAAGATASVDSYGHEMPGVKLLIDDGNIASTVQSIDSDTYTEWKSKVHYGATRGTAEALTTLRMMGVENDIITYGEGSTDFMITSPGVYMTYGNLCDQTAQVVNPSTYDNGWPTLSFNGRPLFQDPYITDEIFFIDTSALALYEAAPAGWIDTGGSVIRQTAGASGAIDAQEACWRWYVTLGITDRQKCGKLEDITVVSNQM